MRAAVDKVKRDIRRLENEFPMIRIRFIGSLAGQTYPLYHVNDLDVVYYTTSANPALLAKFRQRLVSLAKKHSNGAHVTVEFRDGPLKPYPQNVPVLQIHAVWHYSGKKLYKWLRNQSCLIWYRDLVTKRRSFFMSIQSGPENSLSERFVPLRPSPTAFTTFCVYAVLRNTRNFLPSLFSPKCQDPLARQLRYFTTLDKQLKRGTLATAVVERKTRTKTLQFLDQLTY